MTAIYRLRPERIGSRPPTAIDPIPGLPMPLRFFLRVIGTALLLVILGALIPSPTVADPVGGSGDTGLDEPIFQEDRQIEPVPWWEERIQIGILAELGYEYSDISDTGDRKSGQEDDFFIDVVEVDIEIFLSDWLKTTTIAGIENIGKNGDDPKPFLDEATLRLRSPRLPIYSVIGKRTQPFGILEDHLISGTLLEDLYEIAEVGATVGVVPDYLGLDLSLTVYKNRTIIENLNNFDTHDYKDNRQLDDEGSVIANLTVAPAEKALFISAYYNNEPGDGRRNQTLGGGMTILVGPLSFDVEFAAALSREEDQDGEEHLENAWVAGMAYRPLDWLELATRFEDFDDDRKGNQDEVVDWRYLAGFNWELSEDLTLSFEYRYTDFEKERGSNAASRLNEISVLLSFEI